jgi:hypothetical protein
LAFDTITPAEGKVLASALSVDAAQRTPLQSVLVMLRFSLLKLHLPGALMGDS